MDKVIIKASDITGTWNVDKDFTQQTMYAKSTGNENTFVKNAFTFPWRFLADTDSAKGARQGQTSLQEATDFINRYDKIANSLMSRAKNIEIKEIEALKSAVQTKINKFIKLNEELKTINQNRTPAAYAAIKDQLNAIAQDLTTLTDARDKLTKQIEAVEKFVSDNFKIDGQLTEAEARIAAVEVEQTTKAQDIINARGEADYSSSLAQKVIEEWNALGDELPKLGWFSHPNEELVNKYLRTMHDGASTPEQVTAAGEKLKNTIKDFSTQYNARIDAHVKDINQDKFNWRVDTHLDAFKNTPGGLLNNLPRPYYEDTEDLHRFHDD